MIDQSLDAGSYTPRKILALIAVCTAAAAMPLTFTGTAVAIPAIGRALGGSPIALNWITNAFMLTFGSGLMATGALADSYGRKSTFLVGIAAFAVLSACLAAASNIIIFDILRALQGMAAAAAFSAGMASLAQEFEGSARLRAFSIVGASFGVGLSLGPIGSGLMIQAFGWPSIFILVVVVAVIALGAGAIAMTESRDPDASGLDWPGATTFTLALTLFTYGVLRAPQAGWGDAVVLGLLFGAALMLAAFVVIERSVKRPMLDLTLFRYPRFVGVQLLAASPAYAFVVLLILLPVRFVGIEGMGEVAAGRLMIALTAPLLVLPIAAGLLSRWFAPAIICGTGLVVSAAGLFWLSLYSTGTDPSKLIPPLLLMGVGISLPWGLMDGLAVSVVPKERAGMATGIFSTTRVAGEGVALAVVGAVLSAFIRSNFGPESGNAELAAGRLSTGDLRAAALSEPALGEIALFHAYGTAFTSLLWVLAAITLITALVVFVFLAQDDARAHK